MPIEKKSVEDLHRYDNGGNGDSQLIRSVVAFVDILGVRETMAPELGDARHSRNLRVFTDAYSACLKELREQVQVEEEWGAVVKAFTDNLVIAYPLGTPGLDEETILGGVVLALAYFQMDMAMRGLYVRGGIDIGNVYAGDGVVFGPALLAAYNLESTKARDPRIILSGTALEAVRRHTKAYAKFEDTPQFAFTLLDADGSAFINYLGVPLYEVDEPPELEMFEAHKKWVEELLVRYQSKPYVWSKYRWVASYHNFICETHGLPERLKIGGSMELRPRPLTKSSRVRGKVTRDRLS